MSITKNDNFLLTAPKLIDDRSAKFVGGVTTPYASVAEVYTILPATRRARGLTVLINVAG